MNSYKWAEPIFRILPISALYRSFGEHPKVFKLEHLLFTPEEFEGWDISDGFYDPYRKDRFNAVLAF